MKISPNTSKAAKIITESAKRMGRSFPSPGCMGTRKEPRVNMAAASIARMMPFTTSHKLRLRFRDFILAALLQIAPERALAAEGFARAAKILSRIHDQGVKFVEPLD